MTENEAIINLKTILEEATNDEDSVCYVTSCDKEHLEMAIQALEKQSMVNEILNELREYSSIGTVEEFKDLKEKNTPKKVEYQGEHEKCPSCGSFHVFGNYCTECGQKLDWGKGEKQ